MEKILISACEGITGLQSEAFRPRNGYEPFIEIMNALYDGEQELLSVVEGTVGKIQVTASTYLLRLASGDDDHSGEEFEKAFKDGPVPLDLKKLLMDFDWSTSFPVSNFIESIVDEGQIIKITQNDSAYGDSELTIEKA
jgi:hypothetical protein